MTNGDDLHDATELANQIRAGDRSRFDALYETVAPSLYAWAALRVPGSISVDDFLQEVWLRGVRALHDRVEPFESFHAWIYQVARHVLLELLRRHLKLRATAHEPMSALDERSAHVTSISMRLAQDDTVRRFLDHARALDEEDRELLVFCGLEGRPCREVAVRVGLREDAAWKRWQRLRARLRATGWANALLIDQA